MFAKTSTSGLTRYFTLRLNSVDNSALFEYRPEGLNTGFQTVLITDLSLGAEGYRHLVVTVYDSSLLVYLNGVLHTHANLIGSLEDGPGTLYLGGIPGTSSEYFSGIE